MQTSVWYRYKVLERLVSGHMHIVTSAFPAINLPWVGACAKKLEL
jgi:hypothetical protein